MWCVVMVECVCIKWNCIKWQIVRYKNSTCLPVILMIVYIYIYIYDVPIIHWWMIALNWYIRWEITGPNNSNVLNIRHEFKGWGLKPLTRLWHVSCQKHFQNNIRSWIENEWHCLCTADISNDNFTNQCIYIYIWLFRVSFQETFDVSIHKK